MGDDNLTSIGGILSFSPTADNVYLNSVVDYQKASLDSYDTVRASIARVLIVYTGGTIGMKPHRDKGYHPVTNWFYDTLAGNTRFHDPSAKKHTLEFEGITSDRETGGLVTGTTRIKQAALVTPKSIYGKRVMYGVLEYDPLLDSANMNMNDWVKIARDIEINYRLFDGFLVVHGTDTMAYTASALSFLLEDLSKNVVLTGSQVPLAEWRTDAEQNLLGALLMASHFRIPEVSLYMGQKLYRGNRTTKIDALDFTAFDSPNMKPLARTGVSISINWKDIRDSNPNGIFNAHKEMNPNVAALRLFPGITASTVAAFFRPPMLGVVLETYGAGNAPTSRSDLLTIIDEACRRGVVIVNCTQCKKGNVSDIYATGKALAVLGVVPGGDMTPECALTKLSYLLGKGLSLEKVRMLLRSNLRGELSVPGSTMLNDATVRSTVDSEGMFDPQDLALSSAHQLVGEIQDLLQPVVKDVSIESEIRCLCELPIIIPGEKHRRRVLTTSKTFEDAKKLGIAILLKHVRDRLQVDRVDSRNMDAVDDDSRISTQLDDVESVFN